MDIPLATYRLQFNHTFTLKDAQQIISYLAELGISHIYASPIFKAKKGSLHGYDITDHRSINDEIGSNADFENLIAKINEYRMGWIQDIVPNHMAIDYQNKLLMELFEHGREDLPCQYFDIEWNHRYKTIRGRLLTPILGNVYGDCLEKGEIKITYDKDGFSLRYYDHRFPLRIETYALVMEHGLVKLKSELGTNHSGLIKLLGVLFSIKNLPGIHQMDERKLQSSFTKSILWELYTTDNAIREFIDSIIAEFNGVPGKPESFSFIDSIHSEQLFKLSFWKVATEELNYRRFFTVNDLISLRVEDEQVFRNTHGLIFELINQGKINGLRVDHIDGLYDPHTYLERLRRSASESYIIVEKILGFDEMLPTVWPVQGTTGYDFCNYVNALFCKKENQRLFEQVYHQFTGNMMGFEQLLVNCKRIIVDTHLAGDIDNLAILIKDISGKDRRGTDITLYGLRKALIELMIYFPVYRSYINNQIFSSEDRMHLQIAIHNARKAHPDLSREFAFIEKFLLLKFDPYATDEEKKSWTDVVMRFQQFTGPLMAKGFEDTLFYNYNRLISLNEVGGFPQIFGIHPETYHHFNSKRVRFWPNSMNATSTHDSKRGEDLRARINVLSEIPDEWNFQIKNWAKINKYHKENDENGFIPDSNDEYLLYQTLVGTFQYEEDQAALEKRISDFMLKATREAKVHTDWIAYNHQYEQGLLSFIRRVLDRKESVEFFNEFVPFQNKVAQYGLYNSLSQVLLKITSPGVPDFYQGTELWDLNLVDPDNRKPVDFDIRKALLNELKQVSISEFPDFIRFLLSKWKDGRIKLFLIYRCNKARNDRAELFQRGAYIPLTVSGIYREHILAFARKYDTQWAVVAVPRFLTSIINENQIPLSKEIWADTSLEFPAEIPLSGQDWYNVITGESIQLENQPAIGDLFRFFPGAFLVNLTA
ncbi:MAG TPA: malto-oligosyltrehalose synthase [Chitinispirillaceae bacterium]|nr:malto-oligosyltrehalose synthase [Chitinispirillaceae bacterium]